jgi:hypothetical protein
MLQYAKLKPAPPPTPSEPPPADLAPADCLALGLGEALDLCSRDAARRVLHGRIEADWSQLHAVTMVNLKRLGFHCDRAYRTILYHEAKAQPGRAYGEALATLFESQPWSRSGMIPASVVEQAFGVSAGVAPVVRLSATSVIA